MTYKLEYVNDYNASITFSFESGFILSATTGLTSNTVSTVNSQGINQIGGTLQGQSVQPRIVTCKGTIRGESAEGRKILLDTILPNVQGRLIYDNAWQIDVVPKITPDVTRHRSNATFNFSLEAAYPYWRKISESMVEMSYIQPMTDFIVKHWLTVAFGLVTTGFAAAYRHLAKRLKSDKAENEAVKEGVKALLADRLIQLHNLYTDRGYCPIYAKQNAESLYKAYHDLGGNGTMTDLYNRVLAMQTEKKEE